MKTILLTFDLEEFDLPRLSGNPIEKEKEYEISKEGLFKITNLLKRYNINATFFTTVNFAKKYPKIVIDLIKEGHEIACHGFEHESNHLKDISKFKEAKKELEKIIKVKVNGCRAPRFQIKNISGLHDMGFVYDSSMHPTFIPGRYNNLNKPRKIHKIGEIIEISPSTLPLIRLPIFWFAFKNFGLNYAKIFTKINMISSDYTMLLFHPWEFNNLTDIKISWYMKRNSGDYLLDIFNKYLFFAKQQKYKFETITNFLSRKIF
jgi:hypothetical protein